MVGLYKAHKRHTGFSPATNSIGMILGSSRTPTICNQTTSTIMYQPYPCATTLQYWNYIELNQPGKAELPPFVEEALVKTLRPVPAKVKPAKQIVIKLTTTPKPADTQTDFIEYTPSFKPPKRIISRLAPEGLN
ncbi:hypothetical protein OUZ56_012938 [Daphnia magna]|uniref:Uncharacterized protein n=1 Tax=Daphnia magna TaxID=35525 RepID=A0ABQ9Z4H1_9CRUS|nr:hypothetical protein OUZ56_012938 [Daphnia magna]